MSSSEDTLRPRPHRRWWVLALVALGLFAALQVGNILSRPDPVGVLHDGMRKFGADPEGLGLEQMSYGSWFFSYEIEGRFVGPDGRFVEIEMERWTPFLAWEVRSFEQGRAK